MDDYGYETKIRRAAKYGKAIGFKLYYNDDKACSTSSTIELKNIVYVFKTKTSAANFMEAIESIITYKKYNMPANAYNINKARKAVKNLVLLKRCKK